MMNEVVSLVAGQSVEIDYVELDRIIEQQYGNDRENLIMILQAIQNRYNYLPNSCLRYLSEKIDVPLSKIYGVATFYKTFSLEPRGRKIISICLGTACHVRGSEKVMERVQETLNARSGETTQDGRFTLEPVRCLGCCSHGPVVKVNEDIHSGVSPDKIDRILDERE